MFVCLGFPSRFSLLAPRRRPAAAVHAHIFIRRLEHQHQRIECSSPEAGSNQRPSGATEQHSSDCTPKPRPRRRHPIPSEPAAMSAPAPPAFDRTPGACSACAQQKGEKQEERHMQAQQQQRECSQQRRMGSGSALIVTAHWSSICAGRALSRSSGQLHGVRDDRARALLPERKEGQGEWEGRDSHGGGGSGGWAAGGGRRGALAAAHRVLPPSHGELRAEASGHCTPTRCTES